VRLDLLDRLQVDERPIIAPGSNLSASFIAPAVLAKRVIDTALRQNPVGAHGGPA
jgi:hypothetical protein